MVKHLRQQQKRFCACMPDQSLLLEYKALVSVENVLSQCLSPLRASREYCQAQASEGDCGGLLASPCVGDYCCAQFTEDDCWYRAVVVAVNQNLTEGSPMDTDIGVQYIDYGNCETLPLCRLRALEESFLYLPSQALLCSLAGIFPVLLQLGNDKSVQWPTIRWLKDLLLGECYEMQCTSVTTEDGHNLYGIELFVSTESLLSVDLPNDCPVSVQEVLDMPELRRQESPLHLTLFLKCVRMAIEKNSLKLSSLSAVDEIRKELPMSGIIDKEKNESRGHGIVGNANNTSSVMNRLEPLSITLGSKYDFPLLVSHVISPKEFYIHPIQEDIVQRMSCLSKLLSDHYSIEANRLQLNDRSCNEYRYSDILCCVQCVDDNEWYRGVLQSIDSDKICLVQLLDYGECTSVPLDCVYQLDKQFNCPPQAICCSLAEYDSEERVCKALKSSAVQSRQLMACIKGPEMANCSEVIVDHGSILTVDVIDTSGDQDVNINQLIPEQTQPDKKDPTVVKEPLWNTWNPMESEYLAQRNTYSIDDEDAGLALHGYSHQFCYSSMDTVIVAIESTNRPCRFFQSKGGCANGNDCKYLHLQEGVSDQQLEEVFTSSDYNPLPAVNAVVVVIVTAVVSAVRFFVQIPLGPTSILSKVCSEEENCSNLCLTKLLKDMSTYYDQHVFSDRSVILAEVGEIVAVRYTEDDQWYRARVVNSSSTKTKVFFVDYGHYGLVSDKEIRTIRPEFLILPFQAVECYLTGVDIPDKLPQSKRIEAKEYFKGLVVGQMLMAKVVTRMAGVIGVELYSDVFINKVLADEGILERKNIPVPIAGSISSHVPG